MLVCINLTFFMCSVMKYELTSTDIDPTHTTSIGYNRKRPPVDIDKLITDDLNSFQVHVRLVKVVAVGINTSLTAKV